MIRINRQYPLILGLRPVTSKVKNQADYIAEIARYNSTIFREGNTDGFSRDSDIDTNAKRFVQNALGRALGRRLNTSDPKAMLASIDRAFSANENEEGNRTYEWTPRSYAVQTELGGKVTGAQASLYRRAKSALDEIVPLLDRLEPLENAPDEEEVEGYRAIVRQEIITLVDELGIEGGWRESRVNLLFSNLLGAFNPVQIGGHLADLGRVLGYTQDNRIVTIGEEEIFTDFIVIYDLIQSLRVSWQNLLAPLESQFLGTKVVLIERALQSLAEGVDELQYIMESVGLGPAERRVVRLEFEEFTSETDFRKVNLTIDEMLDWIVNFASEEGPNLIENAGSLGIETLLPTLTRLYQIVLETANANSSHNALQSSRVEYAIDELASHIHQVFKIISPDSRRLDSLREFHQSGYGGFGIAIANAANKFHDEYANPKTRIPNSRALSNVLLRFAYTADIKFAEEPRKYYPPKHHNETAHHHNGDYAAENHQADYFGRSAYDQPDPAPDAEYGSNDRPGQIAKSADEVPYRPETIVIEDQQVPVTPYDDLTDISGIGEGIANVLYDAGITDFERLGQCSIDQLQDLLRKRKIRCSEDDISNWIDEANKRVQRGS